MQDKGQTFRRSDGVLIFVRPVLLGTDETDTQTYVEIREYIEATGLFAHGIVLPLGVATAAFAYAGALSQRLFEEQSSQERQFVESE